MIPRHHPPEATLFEYGGGSLCEAMSLVVATHIAVCPLCREKLNDIESIGGLLLEDLPPAPLNDDAFAQTLARLDAPPSSSQNGRMMRDGADPLLSAPLKSYLPRGVVGTPWKTLAPGVSAIEIIPEKRSVRAMLFRVGRGRALPSHGHRGREMTVVLDGAFSDHNGQFSAGDFVELDAETDHQPIVSAEGDCVSLVAYEGRLRMHSLWGAFVGRLVNI